MMRGSVPSARFERVGTLGSGGFGTVYEALDGRTGQRVALKELARGSTSALARFKQEFRALADLHHPNLVALKELNEQDGRWFIAMELVRGDDLLGYVRSEPAPGHEVGAPDIARVREAFRGMAQGLIALHEHGILHRDLKPSNVRVTPEGRAVLLDFGLVTSVNPEQQSTHGVMVGTVGYMAPEQATGHALGPEMDWYSFGVCLYEVLTGCMPFPGDNAFKIMLDKQSGRAPRPSTVSAGVPADLDSLCVALLEPKPERRAGARDVLRVLGDDASSELFTSLTAGGLQPSAAFAGREGELEHLERALALTHQGELRIVLVEGESGVGKSALVGEFLQRKQVSSPRFLSLKGRCYENEQVPYKAFDGCMDELARTLRRMGAEQLRALLPNRAALLGQLFPVLRDALSSARLSGGDFSADPTARRLEAFGALCELLAKLAEERPLVLVIDDLQWADAESFRLLRALVEHRERPALLLIATVRPRDELEPEVRDQISVVRDWSCADVVKVLGLPASQARALAASLLGPEAAETWCATIAAESRGHPLLLSELLRYASSHDLRSGATISLDVALAARIKNLPTKAGELLELVALAGRPYGSQVFANALSVPDVEEWVRPLLAAKLLRTRRAHELGCFHDRIRHVAVSLIARSHLAYRHKQLARALSEARDVDPSEQARHWDLAGEEEMALSAYERAADHAIESLAFARAEALYGRALDLLGKRHDEQFKRLTVRRAEALAQGGRSAEAAPLYRVASELCEGHERVRLRTHVAQQLLQSAALSPGLAAARELLAELGVSLPKTDRGALRLLVWERMRSSLIGRSFTEGAKTSADSRTALALEAMRKLSSPVQMQDVPAGLALSVLYVRLASQSGDRSHMARASAFEGWTQALNRSLSAALPLFEQSRKLAPEDDASCNAMRLYLEGSARVASWDFAGARACLEPGYHIAQTQCAGEPWLLTITRRTLGSVWRFIGEFERLSRESETWIAEARERKDRHAVAELAGLGFGHLRHLMRDDPEAALKELEDGIAEVPSEPFAYAHFGHLSGVVTSHLYSHPTRALEWLDAREAKHRDLFLLRTRLGKEALLLFQTSAILRASEVVAGSARKPLLLRSRASLRKLQRIRSPFASAYSALMLSQLETLEGKPELALTQARAARNLFESMGHFGAHSAAYVEGLLEGGASGAEKQEAALQWYRDRGWKAPLGAMIVGVPALYAMATPAPERQRKAAKLIRDRYEVIRPLGRGGFGAVVEALDHQTKRNVALKELVRTSPAALGRFKQEFRAVQGVHHPSLVRLEALFEHADSWYIAMELVDGSDLLSWVRSENRPDLARVRSAFRQLCEAARALHVRGLVHRDINPKNVRVTPEGRVVLLDFGLIARVDDERDRETAGTAAYLAPEQLLGAEVNASSDVYAIGVCLYQALAGRLPFEGTTPLSLSAAKRKPPAAISPSTASELEALCLRMLDADPRARPALPEVLAFFSQANALRESQNEAQRMAGLDALPPLAFAGRLSELSSLMSTFERARLGSLSLTLVEGESGVGKSALVAELLQRVQAEHPAALVLRSRCYENEQVAFKAFDEAIDELALWLSSLPRAAVELLLPKRAALLAQLFPVLASVPAIGEASRKGLPAEPSARRLQAFSTFVQLLRQCAASTPMILVIDDLQWSDAESFRLLKEVARGEDPPALAIIAMVRPRAELAGEMRELVDEVRSWQDSHVLTLQRLPDAEAEQLANGLLQGSLPQDVLRSLIAESKGHPLFLRELLTHVRNGALAHELATLSLNDALLYRIRALSNDARVLLELTALAGKPYGVQVFSRALNKPDLPSALLADLLAQGLLRTRGDHELACFHDRLRQVVLDCLDEARTRELSGWLARALEDEPNADAAERAYLWDRAGETQRALSAYGEAGKNALEGLAFARAEALFARALDLAGEQRDDAWRELMVLRGHACARAGRGVEAANAYQAAVEGATGELTVRLRIWVAEQLIVGAQLETGMKAASSLLADLGLPFPKSERSALLRIAWDRSCLQMRGLEPTLSDSAKASSDTALALEALEQLSGPLTWLAFLPGTSLSIRYLRLALDQGGPEHSARALALEGMVRSVRKPGTDQSALFARSLELTAQVRQPATLSGIGLFRGVAALAQANFAGARSLLEAAHERCVAECPGEPWLLMQLRMYLAGAWWYLGEYRLISSHVESWLAEADARKDAIALTALTGQGAGSMRFLLRDEPALALAELDRAMAPWPSDPFSWAHFGDLSSRMFAYRYQGGRAGHDWFEANDARLQRAFLLKSPIPRQSFVAHHAAAALEALERTDDDAGRTLIRTAERDALLLSKLSSPLSRASAGLLMAVLAALKGEDEPARKWARAARTTYAQFNYFGQHCAAYLEGLLEGGEAGKESRAAELSFFASQGWKDPHRALAIGLPALQLLEARLLRG
jgi:eukaryotic-like serine/threonine-protein kinase